MDPAEAAVGQDHEQRTHLVALGAPQRLDVVERGAVADERDHRAVGAGHLDPGRAGEGEAEAAVRDLNVQVPVVIRMATGAGRQLAAQHSHSLEGWYAHVPGLKVLAPATLADARDVDLVVLGTEGRTGLAGLLLGSTAQRIMVALNTDVLVVRAKGTNN